MEASFRFGAAVVMNELYSLSSSEIELKRLSKFFIGFMNDGLRRFERI